MSEHSSAATALSPCPFCGGEPEYVDAKVIYGKDHAYCPGCKAEVPVDIWNRRTVSSAERASGPHESPPKTAAEKAASDVTLPSSIEAPKQIIDPPGFAVEKFRRKEGRLPNRPGDQLSLTDRLELAAQACHADHLLSCEATCREASARMLKLVEALDKIQAMEWPAGDPVKGAYKAGQMWDIANKATHEWYFGKTPQSAIAASVGDPDVCPQCGLFKQDGTVRGDACQGHPTKYPDISEYP